MPCKVVRGTKVLGNEKSWERKFLGTKGPGNESFQELSFSGNESSREWKGPGTKAFPGKESSGERKVSGTKVPHRDYSFLGTKGLGHEKSRYVKYVPNFFTAKFRCYRSELYYIPHRITPSPLGQACIIWFYWKSTYVDPVIRSFLTGRKQRVVIKGQKSTWK